MAAFVKNINQVRLEIANPTKPKEELKTIAKGTILNKPVVFTADISEYSFEEFGAMVFNFNKGNPKPLTNQEFMERFGYEVLHHKVIKKP